MSISFNLQVDQDRFGVRVCNTSPFWDNFCGENVAKRADAWTIQVGGAGLLLKQETQEKIRGRILQAFASSTVEAFGALSWKVRADEKTMHAGLKALGWEGTSPMA